MPVRPSCRYSGAWAGARTKSGLWRVDGARGDDRGHGGSVLAVGGPAGVLERCVASVCPPSRVSFCFFVVLLNCVLCCCRGGCCSRAILPAWVVMLVRAHVSARELTPRVSFVVCALR
eukprot:SAG31_NODE_1299_length_8918_cov_59.994671_5_plen_118_part_00